MKYKYHYETKIGTICIEQTNNEITAIYIDKIGSNKDDCETNVGQTVTNLTRVWTTESALKYAIYEENFSGEPIKVGRINQSTGTIILLDDFQLNVGSSTKYYISIWLDGNIADSQYVNQSFSGYIKASAIQQDQ